MRAIMNPPKPPCAPGKWVAKLVQCPAEGEEAEAGDDGDEHAFEPGEDELEASGLAHAEVVEPGDEPGGGDGEDLGPLDGEGDVEGGAVEPAQAGKMAGCGRGRW